MNPLVSINITTFNRPKLLNRSLYSIISQSYKNFEVIVVDDCSNDETEEMMKGFLNNNIRIKYIKHKENKGNAAARNTALINSKGKYIAFMDDDDIWVDKNKIKKQVKLFESVNENVGLICTSVIIRDRNKNETEIICKKPENLKERILSGNGIIYSPTVMTKKIILEKVGGFDEKMPRGVDSEFYRACIVKFGYDVYFMSDLTTIVDVGHNNKRMTDMEGRKALSISLKTNLYLLSKYFFDYLKYPTALFVRVLNIIKLYYKLIITVIKR